MDKVLSEMHRRAFVTTLILTASIHAQGADLTLGEIRGKLLGNEVVIFGKPAGGYGSTANLMLDWDWYRSLPDGKYTKTGTFNFVDASLSGTRGKVVTVDLAQVGKGSSSSDVDAFGRPVDQDKKINPYFNVVVELADNKGFIGATGFYQTLIGNSIRLAQELDQISVDVSTELERIKGQYLYNVGYTELLNDDISLPDLQQSLKRRLARDYLTPNLTKLKVVEAELLSAKNCVVVRVELPNNTYRILYGDLQDYMRYSSDKISKLARMNITALERVPKLASKELSSIKDSLIYRGMPIDSVYKSWGYPDKTNDWGAGGLQLIYPAGKYVYVSGGVVRDWQSVR